ncbi:serine/threonine-protein kinase [Streptomyces canus]|uniref:serine/threonine-protein kinase n=1 Tax=Streptomyces canus TaxID=58343 RepID=UPI0033B4B43E
MNEEPQHPSDKRLLSGRYRVDGMLGRGGMSEVFHGYDERLDRRVAIKLLRPPTAAVPTVPDSPEAADLLDQIERDRKRFLREIRTTAQLEHPGIPAVYDTGTETTADGSTQLWLVMQLLRGSTLETLLNQADYASTPPNVAWAASIAAQIAAVLVGVHQVDIVHRDIKPANIMVIDGGLVKILDFGIAILRGTGALPRLTQVDKTVGTPPYMSPEQCLGQAVTSASDIYSLGCLLCELLTGDVPFNATNNMPLRAHHLKSPAPSVLKRRAEVPIALDVLTSSMLAKDPEQRPSAQAVYEALLPHATAHTATPSSGDDSSRDPTRPFRRPLLVAPRPQEQVADQRQLTDADASVLEANVQALLESDRHSQAIRLLEEGVARAAHDAYLKLRLRHLLAAARFYAGEYTSAAALFDAVGRDYSKYLSPNDPIVLDCAYSAGHAYAEIGKPDKALPQLRFYVQNAHPPADDEIAEQIRESRFVISQMLAASGYLDEAQTEMEVVRFLYVDAFGAESTQVRNLDRQLARLREAG